MEQSDANTDKNLDEIKERYGYTDDIRSFNKEQLISTIIALYKDLKRTSDTNNEALDLLTSIKTHLDSIRYDIIDIRDSTSKINDKDERLNLEDIELFAKISEYYNFWTDINHITKRSLFKTLKQAYCIDIERDKTSTWNKYDGVFMSEDWDFFGKIKEYYGLEGINDMTSQSLFYAIKEIYYQDHTKRK